MQKNIPESQAIIIIKNTLPKKKVTLGCLAASSSQPCHHGVSAISNNLHDPGCY